MEAGGGREWEKAREVLGGRSRENEEAHNDPLFPLTSHLPAFKAKKVTDPGVDFIYFQ